MSTVLVTHFLKESLKPCNPSNREYFLQWALESGAHVSLAKPLNTSVESSTVNIVMYLDFFPALFTRSGLILSIPTQKTALAWSGYLLMWAYSLTHDVKRWFKASCSLLSPLQKRMRRHPGITRAVMSLAVHEVWGTERHSTLQAKASPN